MSNAYLLQQLNILKAEQSKDIEQISKYKGLMQSLDVTVKERAQVIRILEGVAKPENVNATISDLMEIK